MPVTNPMNSVTASNGTVDGNDRGPRLVESVHWDSVGSIASSLVFGFIESLAISFWSSSCRQERHPVPLQKAIRPPKVGSGPLSVSVARSKYGLASRAHISIGTKRDKSLSRHPKTTSTSAKSLRNSKSLAASGCQVRTEKSSCCSFQSARKKPTCSGLLAKCV